MIAKAAPERTVKPCRDCGELLVYSHKQGWCHTKPGQWLWCPCTGRAKASDGMTFRCRCRAILGLAQDGPVPMERQRWIFWNAQCQVCFHMRHRLPVATCLFCFPPQALAA